MELATELDALNEILGATGELPVNSLDSGLPDAMMALRMLRSVNRSVQAHGWWFNREKNYRVTPDNDGYIIVTDALDARVTGQYKTRNLILRGRRLYDADAQTYTFTSAVQLDVTWGLTWEDLPSVYREYVTIRAARKHQDNTQASRTKHRFQQDDEATAWAALRSAHIRNTKANSNTGSLSVAKIVSRTFNP